ncbi:hypothetical protein CEXT_315211 [Caerostris extrusa]|uniref:Uncharacterized protein n=1 Tax=Caerostris extrusa TaxID=172846 RepID=A0AAV4MDC8_CAEEX|nr:hypothetical protein CEXT_315211 [Caerostris extrusa]
MSLNSLLASTCNPSNLVLYQQYTSSLTVLSLQSIYSPHHYVYRLLSVDIAAKISYQDLILDDGVLQQRQEPEDLWATTYLSARVKRSIPSPPSFFIFGVFYRRDVVLLGDDIPALHKLSHLLAIHHNRYDFQPCRESTALLECCRDFGEKNWNCFLVLVSTMCWLAQGILQKNK